MNANKNIPLTEIYRHPLRPESYCLYSPLTPQIPPYIGTKKDCETREPILRANLKKEYKKLTAKEQREVAAKCPEIAAD